MPRYLVQTVNIQKHTNQLTREIKRNPAKAAVLGGLLLVAIWFWYPLVQKWMGSGTRSVANKTEEQDLVIPQATTLPTPEASAAPKQAPIGKTDWRSIAQQISDDPWMKKGTLRHENFDPFFPEPEPKTILTSTRVETDSTPDLDVPPETAGLVVTSVIVGGRVPIARINNQNYRVGDTIRATDANIQYTLVQVHPWGVSLKGSQRVHELPIDEVTLTDNHRLVLRNGNLISPEN
ncbi:hypothetical protein C5Y96_21300 [Blastopirellula marina]|uniref:Uncharacterized protein n=1 Tax=Blastopirellula marina TaxID=124 RepID=A0A2S8F1H4_9BACT|nr:MULTISPECIES: hypothetical protein [Pirellulaceae]PQO25990.1 hypothetical protein C5Y96_21300 [Blastopirellula marina]RCS44348.1 hypothetical protein DTL36_21345 [Bremerella cremea]